MLANLDLLLNRRRLYIDRALMFIFLTAYLFILITFFLGKIFDAFHKPFWIDEIYGLEGTIRHFSYGHLLFSGANGQASPAPLDFIICKILDQIKEKVCHFGFTPEVYFRLFANLITIFGCIVVTWTLKEEITDKKNNFLVKATQLALILFLVFVYLFQRHINYFAAEMRPYALWNSLFMITLAVGTTEIKKQKFFLLSLILLSFSATAAIFQLIALAVAYFIQGLINEARVKDILRNGVRLFVLPFCIVVYYCLLAGKFNAIFVGGGWSDFIRLWLHKLMIVPMMLLAIAMCVLKKDNRKYAFAPTAFLIIYLMGPLIFLITRLRGYFYAERQFIYYELLAVIFVLTLIRCIPAYVEDIRSKLIVSLVLTIILLGVAAHTLRQKFVRKFNQARNNAVKVLNGELLKTKVIE